MSQLRYKAPGLVILSGEQTARGANCATGSHASGTCKTGNVATTCCSTGTGGAALTCCTGACPDPCVCGGCASSYASCCTGSCDGADCYGGANPMTTSCYGGWAHTVYCTCYSYGANAVPSCNYGTHAPGTCGTGNTPS